MLIDAERLLDYELWANRLTLESLRIEASPERALRVFAHIIAAHRLFLARVTGGGAVPVWPEPDLASAEAELRECDAQWRRLQADLPPGRQVEYVNSKGERWRSRLDDIVAHLALHSAYHRGQIAMLLGAAGQTPAYTDFIQATRSGAI